MAKTVHSLLAAALVICSVLWPQPAWTLQQDTAFFKNGERIAVSDFLSEIRDYRAVLVGETHDRFDHHLQQLQIIHEIHRHNPDIAIGLEYFQTPFQPKLDAFIQGKIDTKQMLRGTEYYTRWRFDHRLYEPIFNFARDNNIPLVALNVPAEITRKVAGKGIGSLSAHERARLPANIDRSDKEYRRRLRVVFDEHYANTGHGNFENFYEVQILWDEGMASTAARYLAKFPQRKMVILAGMGHLVYGSGIPTRLQSRLQGNIATVVPAIDTVDPAVADYVFRSRQASLPRRGMLGLLLEPEPGNKVRSVKRPGAASSAGVLPGDIITAIDDEPVADLTDLKVSLSHKRPGDTIALQVSRASDQTVTLSVVLH